jgi:hypothetical protein
MTGDIRKHCVALRKTGFFGAQGSGIMPIARASGRVLMVLRSRNVQQPETWGNLGGAHCEFDRPEDGALAQLKDETRYSGPIELKPLLVFRSGSFVYRNFLGIIDDEFTPRLGWEASHYRWITPGQWPRPLHFGIEALLADERSREEIVGYSNAFKRNAVMEV